MEPLSVNAKKWFYFVSITSIIIKCFLAYFFPLTGDEAYYIDVSRSPALGFYDQPPMITWWLSFLMLFSKNLFFLRLPALLMGNVISIFVLAFLKPYDEKKAYLVAILYLITPLHFMFPVMVTDVPLVIFSVMATFTFWRAVSQNSVFNYFFSGAFLGAAFLSKYLMAALFLAFLLYFLLQKSHKRNYLGFAVLLLSSLPFALIHFYWNYQNCWINFIFNVYTRNASESFRVSNVLQFVLFQVYLMTPFLIYYVYKSKREILFKLKDPFFFVPTLHFFFANDGLFYGFI